jgi:mannose-6-phosphate isomerase-like protein (cupin superfamily)
VTFIGETGEINARYRPDGDIPTIASRSGVRRRLIAPGSVTNGQYGLFEWSMPPRAGGAKPHFHKTFSEAFYVTAGTVRLYDGDRWVEAQPGDYLYVPEGGIHAFSNDADEPASMLIVFAPGKPRERYFEEVAEIERSGRTLSYDEWTELYARHDQYRAE